MLGDAALIAFIAVSDAAAGRAFYESTLGLEVLEESPFALVLDAGGVLLRVTPVSDLRPQPFTVAGWRVEDIDAAVDALTSRGVSFRRYDELQQTAGGIWDSPGGDRVAWFTDPDGNVLSLTQFVDGSGPSSDRGRR